MTGSDPTELYECVEAANKWCIHGRIVAYSLQQNCVCIYYTSVLVLLVGVIIIIVYYQTSRWLIGLFLCNSNA